MNRSPRRGLWPWGIAIGLVAMVSINLTMVWIAVSHPSAPAAEDHYAEAEHYDELFEARTRALALGWSVVLRACEPSQSDDCTVEIEVRDAETRPIRGLSGRVEAQRSDDETLDRRAELTEEGDGRYHARLDLARRGLYTFSLQLEGGSDPWIGERRALVP